MSVKSWYVISFIISRFHKCFLQNALTSVSSSCESMSLNNSKVKIESQIICEGQEQEAFMLDVLREP